MIMMLFMNSKSKNLMLLFFFLTPLLIAPLELNFINDSPQVSGGNITADIQFSRPVQSLQCALTGLPYQDCKNPHACMHGHHSSG